MGWNWPDSWLSDEDEEDEVPGLDSALFCSSMVIDDVGEVVMV